MLMLLAEPVLVLALLVGKVSPAADEESAGVMEILSPLGKIEPLGIEIMLAILVDPRLLFPVVCPLADDEELLVDELPLLVTPAKAKSGWSCIEDITMAKSRRKRIYVQNTLEQFGVFVRLR